MTQKQNKRLAVIWQLLAIFLATFSYFSAAFLLLPLLFFKHLNSFLLAGFLLLLAFNLYFATFRVYLLFIFISVLF